MSDLKKKYSEILKNLEENIENPKDLKYVKEQFMKLANVFLDEMEQISDSTDAKIKALDKRQEELINKMSYLENTISGIEKDIYDMDEDGYELEVICPYCNYEFVLEDDTEKEEIECPECGNIIEIDWEGDTFEECCNGHCSGCNSHCEEEENDKNDEDDDM